MVEINTNIVVTAIMGFSNRPIHVPDRIITFRGTLDALDSSGNNLILPATLLAQRGHITDLENAQDAMKGGPLGQTSVRNICFSVCYADRFANKALVQKAADALHDPVAAERLIIANGYAVKKTAVKPAKAPVSLKNKKNNAGWVIAKVALPSKTKQFTIEWGYSYDGGLTWNDETSTPVCTKHFKHLKSGASLTVRARAIVGSDDPMDWIMSNPLTVA